VSEEQQNEILESTRQRFMAAKRQLAAIYEQAERLGIYLAQAGDALRERHSLWVIEYDMTPGHELDLNSWPIADALRALDKDIKATWKEKNRLADTLERAGYPRPE
jgi:hypothetical protein